MINKGLLLRVFILSLFIYSILGLTPLSHGMGKLFPLEKIKPGMGGYGYTVFEGTKIEKFDIKVLAIVDSDVGKEKLILVKLSGKEIESHGGLASGMSGSPVYINNQLVGAISYGFENADSSLALVTPIASMLKLLHNDANVSYIKKWDLKVIPVTTPVIISGMKQRGFELYAKVLAQYGIKAMYIPDLGTSNLEMGKDLLKPGSAVSVMMVAGDYQVSAIGTVTYIDNKNFLAFGHSYTNKGNVNYFVYQANILQTVKSPLMSFKIGAPLKLAGRITQDRQAGILGRLEETPNYIPVQVKATDQDRNITRNSSFYVTASEPTFPDLIVSGVTDTIDQTIDRVGPGTAKVTIKLETNLATTNVLAENIFYGKDIAISCLKELHDILVILNSNDFNTVPISNITVNVEVKTLQTTARIVKLTSDYLKIKPGETLKIKALLHTYRGDNFSIPFEIKVPTSAKTGKYNISVYGGSRDAADGTDGENKKEAFKLEYKDVQSLPEMLSNYLHNPKNNELVLEYDSFNEATSNDTNKSATENENSKPLQIKTSTSYYLLGDAQLNFEIIQP